MIQKFIELRGIGRFHAHKACGEVTLRRVTLIYGQNGRGKSTLADILRSLGNGNVAALAGRNTVGPNAQPMAAQIAIAGGPPASLSAKGWSRTLPNIAVFDSVYVRENVYAADAVTRDHKRNLYRVVVGERAVGLARALDDADDALVGASEAVKQAEAVLRPLLAAGYDAAGFVRLETPRDLAEQHRVAAAQLAIARRAVEIAARSAFVSFSLPSLPADLIPLLGATVASLSAQAEEKVRDHLQSGRTGATSQWLGSGLGMVRDERCPFCDQSIAGNDLIASFRAHFDAAYGDLQEKIAAARVGIDQALADRLLVQPERAHGSNAKLVADWLADGVSVPAAPTIDWESAHDSLSSLRFAALALVSRKVAAPLEALVPDEGFELARNAFEELRARGVAYGAWTDEANQIVSAQQRAIRGADVAVLQQRVGLLVAQQKRAEPSAAAACLAWKDAVASKEECLKKRDAAKDALNKHTDSVFSSQEAEINKLLDHFGASFRLSKTKCSYVGGERSCEYRLTINGTTVDIGRAQVEPQQPGFANLLSSGDKSTLALAFFLTELDGRPNGDTIVVFDDPFTSQDASRRFCTRKRIVDHARRHAQVIVLSHDDSFLRSLRQDFGKEASPLRLDVTPNGSALVPWDIDAETGSSNELLEASLRRGERTHRQELHNQGAAIRRYLESRLRLRHPDRFGEKETLGGMIELVEKADRNDGLAAMKPLLDDLRELRDFTNPLHHGTGAPGEVEERPLDPDEIDSMVARAREVAGAM